MTKDTTTAADLEPAAHYLVGLVRLIIDGNYAAARAAVADVAPDLFESQVDRDLYRAIGLALNVSEAPTILEVRRVAELDDEARSDYADVAAALVKAANAGQYWHAPSTMHQAAEQLRARHDARQARELGIRLAEAADQELEHRAKPVAARWAPPDDVLGDVIRLAQSMRDNRASAGRPGARGLLTMFENWAARKAEKVVVTGFRPVDRAFGGGLPVGLHGIAAGPGAGKSALALQLALGVLLHDLKARVLWFRGEMTDDLVLSKAIAAWSKIRTTSAEGPAPAADLLEVGIRDALRRSSATRPVRDDMAAIIGDRFVSVDPPLTPTEIERRVEEYAPALVVVDYLQLVEVGGFKDRRAEFDHVVRRLAAISARHDLAIVVVSSVAGHTNTESDIGRLTKESNALDFQAHTFVSLWPQGDKDDDPRRVLFKIHKNRTGRLGDEELVFDGAGQFYEPAAVEEHEAFTGYALS